MPKTIGIGIFQDGPEPEIYPSKTVGTELWHVGRRLDKSHHITILRSGGLQRIVNVIRHVSVIKYHQRI